MSRIEAAQEMWRHGRRESEYQDPRHEAFLPSAARMVQQVSETQMDVAVQAVATVLGRNNVPLSISTVEAMLVGIASAVQGLEAAQRVQIGSLGLMYELNLANSPDLVATLREIAESTFPLTSRSDGVVDEFATPDAGKAARTLIATQLMDPEEDPNR